MREFAARHRLALWLLLAALVVGLFVVFFLAGHGALSGGAS